MRVLGGLLAVSMFFGCGRTSQDSVPGAESADGGAGGQTPGIGPFETDGLATAMPLNCPDRSETLAFKLPCAVGQNFVGSADQPGYHVVECELVGTPSQVALSFVLPLRDVPKWLGKTVALPFEGVPPPPPGLGVQLGGEIFSGSLTGDIEFEQADVKGRAFVAHLQRGKVIWSGAQGDSFECSTIEGPLWAVGAWFI